MALSTCIKCGANNFEATVKEPRGSNFKVQFIQCGACGGVVGVMDYYNIGSLLLTLAKKLGLGNIG
jgi:hypothetical protein